MKINRFFVYILLAVISVSCATPKNISYFQDLKNNQMTTQITPVEIKVKPMDKISIVVSCKEPQLSLIYNLPIVAPRLSSNGEQTQGQNVSGYTIDRDGYIDFPILGRMHIAGMTRSEIAQYIKNSLIRSNELKDPIVSVEFLNLYISVLGEVSRPGRYGIEKDYISVLDAISMAGDLTINGQRGTIKVLRQNFVSGEQTTYIMDICNAQSVYSSPAFYLQQGDVIYVEPNDMRARQSTVNGNNVFSVAFWISIASFIISVTNLIVNSTK
ncbi:MAG: polysaccharide biosynthesis/export family protein [Bacteroidales bacterium]|nr:polysaccharide biosynthesis/export family protein [Candidatus Egerieousia equi]